MSVSDQTEALFLHNSRFIDGVLHSMVIGGISELWGQLQKKNQLSVTALT